MFLSNLAIAGRSDTRSMDRPPDIATKGSGPARSVHSAGTVASKPSES